MTGVPSTGEIDTVSMLIISRHKGNSRDSTRVLCNACISDFCSCRYEIIAILIVNTSHKIGSQAPDIVSGILLHLRGGFFLYVLLCVLLYVLASLCTAQCKH